MRKAITDRLFRTEGISLQDFKPSDILARVAEAYTLHKSMSGIESIVAHLFKVINIFVILFRWLRCVFQQPEASGMNDLANYEVAEFTIAVF